MTEVFGLAAVGDNGLAALSQSSSRDGILELGRLRSTSQAMLADRATMQHARVRRIEYRGCDVLKPNANRGATRGHVRRNHARLQRSLAGRGVRSHLLLFPIRHCVG